MLSSRTDYIFCMNRPQLVCPKIVVLKHLWCRKEMQKLPSYHNDFCQYRLKVITEHFHFHSTTNASIRVPLPAPSPDRHEIQIFFFSLFLFQINILSVAKLTDELWVQINDFCYRGGSPESQQFFNQLPASINGGRLNGHSFEHRGSQ